MTAESKIGLLRGKSAKGVPLIVVLFFAADSFFGIAHLFNYVVDLSFGGSTYLLKLNSERSIATTYSSIQLLCIAALAVIVVYHNVNWKDIRFWALLALPLVFLFLAIDETMRFHEELGVESDRLLPDGDRSSTFFQRTGIWMFVLGLPFLATFLLLAESVKGFFTVSPGSYKKVIFGMFILLCGALGFELLSNLSTDSKSAGYVIEVFFEESTELVGATIILWGMHDLASEYSGASRGAHP